MEIVPTTIQKKQDTGLDQLLIRKAELKQEINHQKIVIASKTQNLFTPTALANYVFHSFSKGMNIVDAVMMGYKVVKSISGLFRKFK